MRSPKVRPPCPICGAPVPGRQWRTCGKTCGLIYRASRPRMKFGHFIVRPRTAPGRNTRFYSPQDRRDVVELIDQGWPPLDVAVAYNIPIIENKTNGCDDSYVYGYYQKWRARFSQEEG